MPRLWRAIGVCLLAMCLAGTKAVAEDTAPVGEVTALTGAAVVLRADGPAALFRGAPVRRADTVRTLAGTRLQISFEDGSHLVLGADSKVTVARYAPSGDGQGLLELLRGIVRVVLEKADPWQSFEVETRTAVASARSTQWIVDLTAEGTAVFVVDGTVAVRGAGREIVLRPGFGTDVPPGMPPGDPKQWGQGRVDDVVARTTLRP